MFRRILVPLDGSALAEFALPYAEAMARAGDAQLILIRAANARTFPGTDPTEAEIRAVEEAEGYLASKAERLKKDGFEVEVGVPYGGASDEILTEIRLRKADAIVMATHGRSGLGRWVYGSVAAGVLARSPVPVLLVRSWRARSTPPIGKGTRLLVPLDGSLFAEDALPVADGLARALHGEIVLLRAVSRLEPPTDDGIAWDGQDAVAFEAAWAQADEYLAAAAGRMSQTSAVVTREVREGDATEAIAATCRERGVGLVVMASHRRTGLSRLLLGSVADAVLRRGEVPLLLIGSTEEPGMLKDLVQPDEANGGPKITLVLAPDEVALIRSALGTLGQTVSRHEHLQGRIHALVSRLPAVEERA